MKRISIDSEEGLREVAEALLESLDGRTVVALRGEMGAGKTTLIRAVAEAMGVEDQVTSCSISISTASTMCARPTIWATRSISIRVIYALSSGPRR